jgi:TRAP-type C4-dicarboxylate transport system substrate-binding protein
MRRKYILAVSVFLVLMLLLSLSGFAKQQKWRIGTLVPDFVPLGAGMVEFAKLIEERTDGQISMDCYPVQQLGFWMDEFDNISKGSQEMGFLPPSPRYSQFSAIYMDFVVTNWEDFEEFYGRDGFLFKYIADGCEQLGVKLLGFMNIGFEGYSGMKGPVVYPEDITKLKIKTRVGYPTSVVYYESLGPVVSIDMGEVFTGLQLGTIDCQANQAVETVYTQFHDVTKYFTDTNSMPAFSAILINQRLFDSLTLETQEIIQQTADEIVEKVNRESKEDEEGYYKKFEEEGVVVTRLTPEQREAWIELAKKPGGMWDKARETLGDEPVDFLLENLNK